MRKIQQEKYTLAVLDVNSENTKRQVSATTISDSRENPEKVENGVVSTEAIAESFIMVGSELNVDTSPIKSLDFGSPTKSTNSSGDWCMVSNTLSEPSKEADYDGISRLTDHSSLADTPPFIDPDSAENKNS
jgi:hypothetical protein